ncbi:MAG: radical SAM protein [bacterium]|nr:MAG: radical SAM protein [bacterium]
MGKMFNFWTKARLARSLLLKSHPIYVQYYITARCNLACEQCNIIYSNADVQEASIDEVRKIAANLAKIGVSVVLLTGGEPFVRKDLPEIVKAFSQQNIHVRMQTNGLASKQSLQSCVEAGANDISISLDSLQPDNQDIINGDFPNSWKKAIHTISFVNELFPEDAFTVFGCVLAPRNFEQVPDVIKFATEIGWWVSLVPAHTTNNNQPLNFRTYDPALRFSKELYPKVDAILDKVHQMRESGYNVYDSAPYLADMRRLVRGEKVKWRDRNEGVCDSPNLYFAIVPNGNMAVCCDWRMGSEISVAAPDFPELYFSSQTYDEAQTIAASCPGCLFGSFPEITISSRFFEPMFKRALFFGKTDSRHKLKKLTAEEMFAIAERIRAESPHLYTSTLVELKHHRRTKIAKSSETPK